MTSLLIGASGFLGLNLVDTLQATGQSFVCGTRRRAPRIGLRRRGVQLCHADLDDPTSLVSAMTGKQVVFHLAGHYPALSLDPQATLATGRHQTQTVLDAAAHAGVERLVYVSSTATTAPCGERDATERDVFVESPGLGVYHDLKWSMEQQAAKETRLEVRIACPGACIGPWDQRIGTTAPLVGLANARRVALPDGILNLVDVRDAAVGIAAMGLREHAPKRVLLVGHNLQLFPFLTRVAARYGVEPPHLLSDCQAQEAALEAEEASAVSGKRPALSRELVDLIIEGVSIDASLSDDRLGVVYRTVEQTLNAFEHWARPRRIIPRDLEVFHDVPLTQSPRPRAHNPVRGDRRSSL